MCSRSQALAACACHQGSRAAHLVEGHARVVHTIAPAKPEDAPWFEGGGQGITHGGT
eukprot:CAMPEP_0202915046 /NCGR_PEP_ID=MMETSP1392-20130828/64721_1 /ASSEMBLY_ACC=CAM_ASM_000868 /TAXON_ID=225041 /ORGANISM="Chlamydomonas chlamydogama, Strain SAG 11-48b" /LENGTH=56 /DNA_ID=CAMNT_0049606937 /DNA_START=341 /DNA_END=507 /DNA_ORIENTATION=+